MDKELIRQGRNLSVLIAGPRRTKHIHKSIITRPTIALVGRGEGNYDRTDGQPLIFWPPPPLALVRNMHVVIWEKSGRFIFTAAVARQADSRTIFLAKSTAATALRSQSSVTVSIATADRARAQAYTLSFLLRETTQEIFQEGKKHEGSRWTRGKIGRVSVVRVRPSERDCIKLGVGRTRWTRMESWKWREARSVVGGGGGRRKELCERT